MIEKISNPGGVNKNLRDGLYREIEKPEMVKGGFALIFDKHDNGEDRVEELISSMRELLDNLDDGEKIKKELREKCTEIKDRNDFADKAYKILSPVIQPVSEKVSDESE